MLSLRQIDLVLGQGFSATERKAVTMGSRSMLNFVERRLALSTFGSELTKLNIYCSKLPMAEGLIRYKEPKTLAEIKVQCEPGNFQSSTHNFHRACADLIQRGVHAASAFTPMPLKEITSAVGDFLAGGCVNQWIHTDKRWVREGVRCVVKCDLRTDQFLLWQLIYRNDSLEAESLIAKTKPREFLFYPLLGKLSLKGHQIILKSKANVISSYDLRNKKFVGGLVDGDRPDQSPLSTQADGLRDKFRSSTKK